MPETSNSNTTSETSVPADWTWVAEGEIPTGLSPVCTLSHSSDEHYDIWTATISFSGSVPGNTHAFTGNFSFTMPAGHFTTISLSSDDTASVSVGGILSASSVWGQGTKFVGSPWIENPGTTFAVSGSYGNRGGPYAINAIIVVKRSKTGDVPNTDMTPQISDWRVSGPYEIKTATISFSGTAPGNMFGFSKQNVPFELDGGNWTEISVVSDDNATVSVGSVSVNSSLNAPVAFTGTWQKEYPDKVPVSISYTNVGGPYNLLVTITVKRSRREIFFVSEFNSAAEYAFARDSDEFETEEEKNNWLEECRKNRTIFGSGEKVFVRVRNEVSGEMLNEAPASTTGDCYITTENVGSAVRLYTRKKQDGVASGELIFSDGEILCFSADIRIPSHEVLTEITKEDYLNAAEGYTAIDYGGLPYHDGHYYFSTVFPSNVSFCGIYHWENDFPEEKSGLFLLLPESATKHTPSAPSQLNNLNACSDKASYAVSFEENVIFQAEESQAGDVGVLTWICPIRWSFDCPSGIGEKKNSELESDGVLPARIQKATLKRTPDKKALIVTVSKIAGTISAAGDLQ